jgi:hypothetical protein
VGRNDLPLIDVTSHPSFMVLRLGNGELERFLSCAFPFCFILDMCRLIPKLRPLQVGSGLSAAHSSNICSLLELFNVESCEVIYWSRFGTAFTCWLQHAIDCMAEEWAKTRTRLKFRHRPRAALDLSSHPSTRWAF